MLGWPERALIALLVRFAHLGILQSNHQWEGESHESLYEKLRRFVLPGWAFYCKGVCCVPSFFFKNFNI